MSSRTVTKLALYRICEFLSVSIIKYVISYQAETHLLKFNPRKDEKSNRKANGHQNFIDSSVSSGKENTLRVSSMDVDVYFVRRYRIFEQHEMFDKN